MSDESGTTAEKSASAEEPLAFDRADFGTAPEAPAMCAACKNPLGAQYFTVNDTVTCDDCHHLIAHQLTEAKSAGAFVRALLLGGAAALGGSIAWYAVAKITGMEIGLLAIAVGYVVGHAVRRGSRSPGGRRYQALAMLLTYVSITGSYIPTVVKSLSERPATTAASTTTPKAGEPAASESAPPAAAPSDGDGAPAGRAGPLQLVVAIVIVFGIALVAPFLSGVSNIIGLLLIAIALYEAWKLNKRVPFVLNGPLRTSKLRAAA